MLFGKTTEEIRVEVGHNTYDRWVDEADTVYERARKDAKRIELRGHSEGRPEHATILTPRNKFRESYIHVQYGIHLAENNQMPADISASE
jgi:hypothetical protein